MPHDAGLLLLKLATACALSAMMIRQACLLVASLSTGSCNGPIVQLQGGDAEGIDEGGVGAWRGIPFAAPPVHDLRWRPPQPAPKWHPSVLNAKHFGNACIQPKGYGPKDGVLKGSAEDCLYINVYASLPLSNTFKPVFLWIFGGGFQLGSSDLPVYSGVSDVKVSKGQLIVASFNYRLNVFGFGASSLLRSRDPEGGTGNYGILDQRFAMKWVQDNIGAFGGDTSRVTIIGQSAGANSVSNHLVRRKSWGLFSRAGMESGAFYTMSMKAGHPSHSLGPTPGNVTVAQQEEKFNTLMIKAGCSDIDCLLNLSESKLFEVQYPDEDPDSPVAGMWPWVPAIDGVDLVEAGPILAERGDIAPVPVLVGSNMEDSWKPVVPLEWDPAPDKVSEEDFQHVVVSDWGFNETEAKRLVKLYSNEGRRDFRPQFHSMVDYRNATKWFWAFVHAGADAQETCAARRMARWATQAGQRAFWYYWTYAPMKSALEEGTPWPGGAFHGCEMQYLFQDSDFIDSSEIEFSSQVFAYFSNFFASGNPGAPGLPVWPQFNTTRQPALVFSDNMTLVAADAFMEEKCSFWDMHFRERWGLQQRPLRTIIL